MYVVKAKPQIFPPLISKTKESRTAKLGVDHLGQKLTTFAEFDFDRFTVAGATKPSFHVHLGFLLFFLGFFDGTKDRTAEPSVMVDD